MPPIHRLPLRALRMAASRCALLRRPLAGPASPPVLLRRHLTDAFTLRPDCWILPSRLRCSRLLSYLTPALVPSNADAENGSRETKAAVANRIKLLKAKLEKLGIGCRDCTPGVDFRAVCPKCDGGSTTERCFSLRIREDGDSAVWQCFRAKCGWSGFLPVNGEVNVDHGKTSQAVKTKEYRVINERDLQLEPLCNEIIIYFKERQISAETLRRNGVMQRNWNDQIVIAFTYRRNGSLISCKYRAVAKKFWQETGTEQIFYGLDDIKHAGDIIIVEGEIDKLSMEEAGYRNCVSVPCGAPARVSQQLPSEEKDTNFHYLWACKEYLDKASRIILATDADQPGQALAEELARRLGKERCWRVRWPMKNDTEFCKDANEVLMYFGPDALKNAVENAEIYPILGLFRFSEFFDEIDAYYHQRHGFALGVSTGWSGLDALYNVVPGELTVITGVPNSGKSEWIDALMCNINQKHGWKFALCSMENRVREHARKLLEKHIKKPFFNVRYGESCGRMSPEEFEQGKSWLEDTFCLIRCEDDCLPSITWVLDLAKAAVLRYGIRGLVIDPYNELDHQRPPNQTETEYVSQMLTRVKRFAQHHSCHVWFVAHPKQLANWSGGPPNMYDISGSAHFINKCDNGIVVHRNRDPNAGAIDLVQICVRKVRNKVIGSIGDAFFSYNRVTGEYIDLPGETAVKSQSRPKKSSKYR